MYHIMSSMWKNMNYYYLTLIHIRIARHYLLTDSMNESIYENTIDNRMIDPGTSPGLSHGLSHGLSPPPGLSLPVGRTPDNTTGIKIRSYPEGKNKNKNIRTILRLFPYLGDKTKAEKLKIDKESIYYISLREHAEQISTIITNHLIKAGIDPLTASITDATAGVGGNTVSFGTHFLSVNAIEIDSVRSSYLTNNVNVYGLRNVKVYNGDCIHILKRISNHNAVFIDPPWGGKTYKDHTNLRLHLSDMSIEELCNMMLNEKVMEKVPNLIVLKLPTNYDIKHLYECVKNRSIYFYDLEKMYIIVIA